MTLNGNLGCSFCQGHLNLFILIYTASEKSLVDSMLRQQIFIVLTLICYLCLAANEYAFIYRVSPVTTLETITLPGMLKKKNLVRELKFN